MVDILTIQKIVIVLSGLMMLFGFAMNIYGLVLQRQNNLKQNARMIDLTEQILEQLKK